MNRSPLTRTLIVIFVGVLALAFLFTVSQQKPPPTIEPTFLTGRPTQRSPFLFPEVQATLITRIVLDDPGGKHQLTLVRVPGTWTGTDESGKAFDVDLPQVTRMIQILASLRYNRIMEGSDLSSFGLSNGGVFTVRFEAGASYTLHVGTPTPTGTDAYVQVNDDPKVYLASFADVASLVSMVAKLAEATAPATMPTAAVMPTPTVSATVAASPTP